MTDYAGELDSREQAQLQELERPCANCGHKRKHHVICFTETRIPCDFICDFGGEPNEETLCDCTHFVPADASDFEEGEPDGEDLP